MNRVTTGVIVSLLVVVAALAWAIRAVALTVVLYGIARLIVAIRW